MQVTKNEPTPAQMLSEPWAYNVTFSKAERIGRAFELLEALGGGADLTTALGRAAVADVTNDWQLIMAMREGGITWEQWVKETNECCGFDDFELTRITGGVEWVALVSAYIKKHDEDPIDPLVKAYLRTFRK
jgi:hypothetical protein